MNERVRVRLAVGLTAFCVLAYEVALTRIFSVLFRSPFVFLILSIAVCGLGIGSFWAAARRRGQAPDGSSDDGLADPALALAALLPGTVVALFTLGRPLVADAQGVAVAVFTALPYVAAGLLLARAFRRHADDAGRLYFFDLLGASLAALLALRMLSLVGGIALPLLLGCVAALGALLVAWPAGVGRRAAGVALLLINLALLGAQVRGEVLTLPPLDVEPHEPRAAMAKPLFVELGDLIAGAKILYTQWSPVARTDVVSNTGTETLYIWTDGDVPTQMEPFGGDLAEVAQYQGFIGFVPYALQPRPERVLCIGPGGGLDVLLALLGGAQAIEPVDINPAIVPVVERFKSFYGALYERPEVQPGLVIDDGRSYLSRSRHSYDVIYFALAKAATAQQGGIALVDNYLYTRQAFDAYFDHLTDDGLLSLVFNSPAIADRAVATATAALMARGLSGAEIADRLVLMAALPGTQPGPYQFLVLFRQSPFPAAAIEALPEAAALRGLQLVYAPGVGENEPYAVLRRPGITAAGFADALASQSQYTVPLEPGGEPVRLDLSPVTDDEPFYVDLTPGLHPMLRDLLGWTSLLALLTLAVAGVAAVRLTARAETGPAPSPLELTGIVLYFAVLGAAFLVVEVALIQKLVLLLGYPTLSLTVILFALLLGGAAGGWAANRGTADEAMGRLSVVVPVLVALLALAAWLVPPMTHALLPFPLAVRAVAAAAVVLVLGFWMGQPFPTGLRRLGVDRPELVPVAWAVNGVLSVTGSVLAACGASLWGYRSVLLLGAGAYLLVLVARALWPRRAPGAAAS